MARSLCVPIATVAVDASFAPFGSLTLEAIDAVLTTVAPEYVSGTVYVDVIVPDWPEASVPTLQGNGVVQAPLFETKAMPIGVGSLTTTFVAGDGPLFLKLDRKSVV